MKYLISYFYMIRFFKPNQIPISTAIWDPKWYHDFKSQEYVFFDANGVINGLRSPILNPQTSECANCTEKEKNCSFKCHYLKYLHTIDFNSFIKEIETGILNISNKYNIDDPEIILIVHEAPDNTCSERLGLQQWFKENGRNLEEFIHKKEKNNLLKDLL